MKYEKKKWVTFLHLNGKSQSEVNELFHSQCRFIRDQQTLVYQHLMVNNFFINNMK